METNGLTKKAEQWREATSRPLADLGQQVLDQMIEQDIIAEGEGWRASVDNLTISDQASYEAAAELLRLGSDRVRMITGAFDEPRELSHTLHSLMTGTQKLVLDPYRQGVDIIARKIGSYDAQKQREREAEQRRLQDEARQQQAKEAADIAAQHKQDLIDQGVPRKEAEAARREIEKDIKASPAPVVSVAPNITRAAGVTTRKPIRKGEVFSLMTLIKAVAAGKADIKFLQVNESALNAQAKNALTMPPGTRSVEEGPKAYARKS